MVRLSYVDKLFENFIEFFAVEF